MKQMNRKRVYANTRKISRFRSPHDDFASSPASVIRYNTINHRRFGDTVSLSSITRLFQKRAFLPLEMNKRSSYSKTFVKTEVGHTSIMTGSRLRQNRYTCDKWSCRDHDLTRRYFCFFYLMTADTRS